MYNTLLDMGERIELILAKVLQYFQNGNIEDFVKEFEKEEKNSGVL